MTALPYQPVPTATQQRELERWVSKHYPVRQYEQTQALISPVEAAGVACCATDVAEVDGGMPWVALILACLVGLAMWGAYAVMTVLAVEAFGMAGLIGSILGACAIVGAVAKLGRFV